MLHNVPCLTKMMRMLESIEVIKPDLLVNRTYILVGQIVVFECKLISRETTRTCSGQRNIRPYECLKCQGSVFSENY